MTRAEFERREAWRSVIWSSGLDIVCAVPVALILSRSGLPAWPLVQFAVVGALCLTVALLWRGAPRRVSLVLFSLNVASALLASLAGANAVARTGQVSGLFQSVNAGLIIIAILSPSRSLGVAWIALFSLAPLVEVHLWPAAIRDAIPSWQPWFVPIYGAIALVLLLYRRRSVVLERALSDARANRLVLTRLASLSLAVRDLANTPLQTLNIGVGLLRHEVPDQERVLASMERALVRLENLKLALAPFETGPLDDEQRG